MELRRRRILEILMMEWTLETLVNVVMAGVMFLR